MSNANNVIANAILGIDTLWGGDVMCPSGAGRFIADSWFSDDPLPVAYSSASAARVRQLGGVSAKEIDRAAVEAYLKEIDLAGTIEALKAEVMKLSGLRAKYLAGLAVSIQVMYDLALELIGQGEAVPYERCVIASTGHGPEPSAPEAKRARLAELLSRAGVISAEGAKDNAALLAAVDAWRRVRTTPMASVRTLSAAVIAYFDQLCVKHVCGYLPQELESVPRANIDFLPIKDAWFSGSMNYVGRARRADGSPLYEATYEINASLEISVPEFYQLISHEVVPGHVTTFAYLQNLYTRGLAGFEATVLTMNTRAAALFEGIANNAILIAHGITELSELPDEDMQIGALLALLQDDAKNQSGYMTWGELKPQAEVALALRNRFLVTAERADKLSGAWGRHPLMGRMYLPAYRAGTEKVAEWRRKYAPEKVLPVIYGCEGMVDVCTAEEVLESE